MGNLLNFQYDYEKEEKKIVIKELTEKLWIRPENFNDEENITIHILFSEDNSNKKYFVENINKYRGNGVHEISSILYDKLSYLLNILLENIYQDKDFMVSKYCMILSQTFYKLENEKKHYLQDAIEKNKLFDNLDFWEEYIACNYYYYSHKTLNFFSYFTRRNRN